MSNTGQAALTILGTVVGAYFGNPQLGFALGSLAGQALFPTQLPTVEGPRLADISSTTATVGAPIPRVWGRAPLPGNIIWQSDVRELVTSDDMGGKGTPTQSIENVSYYQSFCLGLCDRPPSRSSAIKGVRRIQANGKFIYDIRPQLENEGDEDYKSRVAANVALEEIMTIYRGTATEMPDPTMESQLTNGAPLGVGGVSAYRDRAKIVFTDWLCKPEDGNRIPGQWMVEVFTEGELPEDGLTEWSNQVLYPWLDADNPVNPMNDHSFSLRHVGTHLSFDQGPFETVQEALTEAAGAESNPSGYAFLGHSLIGGLGDAPLATTRAGGASASSVNAVTCALLYNKHEANRSKWFADPSLENCGGLLRDFVQSGDNSPLHTNAYGSVTSHSFWRVEAAVDGTSPGFVPPTWDGVVDDCFEFSGHPYNYINSEDVEIFVERVPRAPDDPCHPRVGETPPHIPGAEGFAVVDGRIVKCGAWEYVAGSFNVLQVYEAGPIKYPLNPARPVGHADDNEDFWSAAYDEAVARGDMAAGLTYGVHYPETQGFAYQRALDFTSAETDPVSIATILRDNFIEAGLDESDFDVSSLESEFVIGFVRTRPMTARAVAESLRPVGSFDIVESGGKLKCVKRGGAIVATLKETDLGARDSAEPATAITSTKKLEMQIPRVVRVHFISDDQDLQPDAVSSPISYDSDTDQEVDAELVVVMSTARGRQIAETMWADFRISANTHQISTDLSYARLEPADPIAVPLNGQLERMRILDIDERTSWVRLYQLAREEEETELGAAIGRAPPIVPPTVRVNSPLELLLLDLPPLQDEDDDPGVYVAVRPFIRGASLRGGAQILRSADEGGNYARVGGIATTGTIGTVLLPLAAGIPEVWDEAAILRIELQSGSLESRTEADVLDGANAAAVGVDGRWEIVQFQDVTQIADTIFDLTVLLRGRRGTEHFIGTSQKGDRFVLLSTGGIARVPLPLQSVGRELLYKCVLSGVSINSIDSVPFTGQGVALRPFSPVAITGEHRVNGDWDFSWIRRSRLGEAWPDYADVPIAEEREDYEIDILDGSNVVRTISTSEPTVTYTLEQQQADFGIGQANISLAVYQISTAVGRGQGATAALRVALPEAYEFMFIERGSIQYVGSPDGTRVGAIFPDAGSFVLCLDLLNGNCVVRRHPNVARVIDTSESLGSVGVDGNGFFVNATILDGVTFVITRDLTTGRTKLSRVDAATTSVTHTETSGGVSLDFEQIWNDGTSIFIVQFDGDQLELDPDDLSTIATTTYDPPPTETPAGMPAPIDTLTIGAWIYAAYSMPPDSRLFVRRYSATTGVRDQQFSVTDVGGNSFGVRRPYISAHGQYLGIGVVRPTTVLDTVSLTLYREQS